MSDKRTGAEEGSSDRLPSALECLQRYADRSVYSQELYRIISTRPDCAPLNPVMANIGRALDLLSISRVLLLNWGDSALPFFLGSSQIDVEVEPADEDVAELVGVQ